MHLITASAPTDDIWMVHWSWSYNHCHGILSERKCSESGVDILSGRAVSAHGLFEMLRRALVHRSKVWEKEMEKILINHLFQHKVFPYNIVPSRFYIESSFRNKQKHTYIFISHSLCFIIRNYNFCRSLFSAPRVCRKLSGKRVCQVLTYTDDASFVRFSQIKAQSNMINLAPGSLFKNT